MFSLPPATTLEVCYNRRIAQVAEGEGGVGEGRGKGRRRGGIREGFGGGKVVSRLCICSSERFFCLGGGQEAAF